MSIDPEASLEAIDRQLTERLGVDRDEAALGVIRILNHNMVRAVELNSVRKGFDPREFSLIAFGGAGPLSGCDVAVELSIPWVIVPTHPGITSALGLLATDLKYEFSKTVMVETSSVDPAELEAVYRELEAQAREALREAEIPDERIVLQRWADCRYTGQAYELLVAAPSGPLDAASLRELEEEFHQRHEREYFYRFSSDRQVLVVHARVYGLGTMPKLTVREIESGGPSADDAVVERLPVGFHVDGRVQRVETPFYDGTRLKAGNVVPGPAIVEHHDATTVINPGLEASVDRYANLIIDCGSA
jgi:N-methylhydantoinase A/oxoprolinase/acetone carboxylase beta subunit